ncbi:GHKL domain-containing protein [Blautia schinkii]|nr:GHKL domain-containing protein [Blautia schinkii]
MFYYIYVFGTLLYMSTCYSLSMYVLSVHILNERINKKSAVLYCTIYFVIQVVANILLMQGTTLDEDFLVNWNIYLYTLHVVILILLLLWTYRQKVIRTVAAAALTHFVVFTIGSLAGEVLISYMPEMENMYLYGLATSVLSHTIMLVCSLLIAVLLRRLEFDRYFEALFTSSLRAVVTLIVSLLLMHVHTIIRLLFPLKEVTLLTASYSVALIVLALFFLQFAAMYQAAKERVKAQEDIIMQQKAHLALLEELQQEMRSFRHDFTNLMTGMTIQAREGDLKGIQDFMRNTSSYFDERLGDEIKILEAVGRIQIPPLRSLITSKIAQMQEAGVQVNAEVLYPVLKEGMRQQDLLRCMGILLDNALEAAKLSTHPHISLVLLQTENELLTAVANSYAQTPDLSAMSHDAYTTKGSGHGTGLMSLRKIIRKYPGCVTGMNLKDEMFRYEIRIPL